MRVLIVEDDAELRELMAEGLRQEAYAVDVSDGVAGAIDHLVATAYDLACIDLGLPDGDGLGLVRDLAQSEYLIRPRRILITTARDAVDDRVDGLDSGADDYLVKPFALTELLARLRALLRRTLGDPTRDEAILEFEDIRLNLDRVEATRGDRPLELTRTELRLLELFMRNPGRVLSRDQMLDRVWGVDARTSSNGVEVYVGYLRRKLEEGGAPRVIQTMRGVGYVLRP